MAQASSSATLSAVRMTVPSRSSSRASSVPSTSVSATLTAQKISDRHSTSQKYGLPKISAKLSPPTYSAGAPNCWRRPYSWVDSTTRRTSG